MGHIIGYNEEEVVLPYGYKTIKVENTESVEEPAIDIIEEGQVADSTQDDLTFKASNRWIKIDNSDEDTVKLGHRLGKFAEGTSANVLYGLLQDEDPTSNLNEDNKFEVPCLSFDEAGHITEARTHIVTLPENYSTIKVEIPEMFQEEDIIKGTAATITAETMTDTLAFKQGNKWVVLQGHDDGEDPKDYDSITLSHYVKKFKENDELTDFNNSENKTFSVQEIEWDEAGHLTASNKHSFTLPDNFKIIAITNNGFENNNFNEFKENEDKTTYLLEADTLVDTATIDTGNRWIQLKANTDEDKVTIYHAPAGVAPSGNTTFDNDETPNYGDTFTIPEVKYDEAGHISAVETHTVKFPPPSINENLIATESSVLTGIQLVPSTLAIT